MYNPIQDLIDWLSGRYDEFMVAINPITLITSLAAYVASFLPEPDPQLQVVVDQAIAALETVVTFISLFDYIINLPVLLTVIGIIFVAEAAFNIFRMWRMIRSFVT